MARIDPQSFIYAVGQNILKFRIQKGLSQDDLAGRTKIDRAVISKYENGTQVMRIDRLDQLAKALEVSPCDLVDTCPAEPDALFTKISQQVKELPPNDQQMIRQTIANTASNLINYVKTHNQH